MPSFDPRPIDQDTPTPEHGCTDGGAGVGVVGASSVSEIRHSVAAGGQGRRAFKRPPLLDLVSVASLSCQKDVQWWAI